MSIYMFPRSPSENLIFLKFSRFGMQIEEGMLKFATMLGLVSQTNLNEDGFIVEEMSH